MTNLRYLLPAFAFSALAMAMPAFAQAPQQPLWEIGAFGGLVSTPAYPASADRSGRAMVLPYFIYRGDILRADRGGVGARIVHTDDTELDIGFAASLPASSADVAARNGMRDLGTLIEFGPRIKTTIARPTPGSRVRLELPVRGVFEVIGGVRNQGLAMEPEVAWDIRDIGGGWSLSTSASVVFGDGKLADYFYGVSAADATTGRAAYEAKAGLITTRVGVSTSKSINRDARMFAFARQDFYDGAANRDSPLFLRSQGSSFGIGFTWTLGRSSEKARD